MKKFKFRLQVVLDMRENELEQRQMEMAQILVVLNKQIATLNDIIQSQIRNTQETEELYNLETLDIQQVTGHNDYGIKLTVDMKNQERIIANTKMLMQMKQKEVNEAHKKVEVLKKLKEKQEQEYYKNFLDAEIKEIDDLTSARHRLR
ncbi:MAG: hypothetical protein MJ231_02580 [bacterium]|nr:hypothetical protein [bacterium]